MILAKNKRCVEVSSKEITTPPSMIIHKYREYPFKGAKCGARVPHLFGSQSHIDKPDVGVFNDQTIHLPSNGIASDRFRLCKECFGKSEIDKFMKKEVIRYRSPKQMEGERKAESVTA